MISRPGPGSHTSMTASQTSAAKSSSVSMKISGEYSKPKSQPGRYCSAYFSTDRAPSAARSRHSSRPTPNTTRRNSGAVALYRCTVARGAPASDCTVRSISSSRAWVSTEICTSSGTTSPVIRLRTKSKSAWLADGNPTSISL